MTSADKTKLDGIETGAEVNVVTSVNTETGDVVLDTDDVDEGASNLYYTESRVSNNTSVVANTAKNSYPSADATKVGHISVTQAVDLDTMESNIATNNAKVGITTSQANAITANTAKNSYPSGDATKVGHISVTQAVDLDDMESDISTNASNISTNTSNISTNTSNISTNTSNISTNTSNISTNTSNISTNTTSIAGKVAKAGDTMTGNLKIENTSATPRLSVGDIDSATNSQSGATFEIGNRATNGLLGSANVNLINGLYSGGGVNFYSGSSTTGGDIATPRALIQSSYTGSSSDYNFQLAHYNGSSVDNQMSMRTDHTYFSQPIRIGANSASNELDDYEEGDFTPQMGGYFGGFTLNSYTTQLGKYIKIGRVVHLFFDVEFTGVSSGSSNLVYLFGLPFIPSSDSIAYGGASIGIRYKKNIDLIISGQYDSLLGMSKLGSSAQLFFNMDDGDDTNSLRVNSLTGSNTDSMALEGCITYRTTS